MSKRWSDIFVFNHIVKRSDGKVYQNGEEITETIPEINYTNGVLQLREITVDELMISPSIHSEEEIKKWHNTNAPFYDAERQDIEENIKENLGEMAYEDVVELAKLGQTVIEGGYIRTDLLQLGDEDNGLFILPDGINIKGKKKLTIKVTAEESYIEIEDEDGNRTRLDENHLQFFQAGESLPHWYTRRVLYDVVENGQYVNLADESGGIPWEHAPKVHTAISSLQTYYPSESDADIYHECYASDVTNEGFRVWGQSYAPIGTPDEFTHTDSSDFSDGDISYTSQNTRPNTSKIDISLRLEGEVTNTSPYLEFSHIYNVKIQYRKIGNSSWTEMGNVRNNILDTAPQYMYYDFSVTGISEGEYEIRFVVQEPPGGRNWIALDEIIANVRSYYNDYINDPTARILYIAVEGGKAGDDNE